MCWVWIQALSWRRYRALCKGLGPGCPSATLCRTFHIRASSFCKAMQYSCIRNCKGPRPWERNRKYMWPPSTVTTPWYQCPYPSLGPVVLVGTDTWSGTFGRPLYLAGPWDCPGPHQHHCHCHQEEHVAPPMSGFLLGFGVCNEMRAQVSLRFSPGTSLLLGVSNLHLPLWLLACCCVWMSGFPASPRTGLLPVIHGTTLNWPDGQLQLMWERRKHCGNWH